MMRQIFNEVIKRNNFTPEEWKKVKIKVIYKKGDVEDVSNYRPICSLLSMYKLFSTIMYGRLYPMLDQYQAEDQAGFRKTYQTTDHLATYRMLEQKCQEWGIKMWTATVDFMKAFDSISHNSIWEALLSCNVDHEYVSFLRKIYRDQKASVQTDEESEIFDIQKGSKQGDPMSSLLFNTVLQYLLKGRNTTMAKEKRNGNLLERPRTRLPDELAIRRRRDAVRNLQRTDTEHDVRIQEKQQRKWDSGSTQTRRRFSATRAPSILNTTRHDNEVGEMSIEIFTKNESVKYLGQRISFHQQETLEIKSRIRAAWTTFHKYRQELTSKKLHAQTSVYDFSTPQFLRLYAAQQEHGHRTRDHERMIQSTQRKMLRLIMPHHTDEKKIQKN